MISRAPRISAKKRAALLKCFVLDVPASKASYHYHKRRDGTSEKITGFVDVSRPTANRWYRHCRELIYMASRRAPRFFGEVEMDQAEFGGRGAKRLKSLLARYKKILPYEEYQKKAKIARAEHRVQVFGILQRGGDVYVHIIKKADRNTLLPIVRLVVEQGAIVYTDRWRGFSELGIDGYTHHSVNHSEEYVDQKGNHINGIESFWSFAARRLRKFNGVARTTLPLHIKECEWRYNQKDVAKALKALLADPLLQSPRPPSGTGTVSPRPAAARRRPHHTSHTSSPTPPSPPRARLRAGRQKANR